MNSYNEITIVVYIYYGKNQHILCQGDGIGIHVRLRCVCRKAWEFESPL